jgi:hypothetical protein
MKEFERLALAEALSEMSMAIRDLTSLVASCAYGGMTSEGRAAFRTAIDHSKLATLAIARLDVSDADLDFQANADGQA